MREQSTVRENRDVRRDGFDVRHDMRRQNHDALAGKLGKQIAKSHALFRIESRSRLIDNEKLRIVEQSLRNADTLPHAAGIIRRADVSQRR